jgi:hypothetical protein
LQESLFASRLLSSPPAQFLFEASWVSNPKIISMAGSQEKKERVDSCAGSFFLSSSSWQEIHSASPQSHFQRFFLVGFLGLLQTLNSICLNDAHHLHLCILRSFPKIFLSLGFGFSCHNIICLSKQCSIGFNSFQVRYPSSFLSFLPHEILQQIWFDLKFSPLESSAVVRDLKWI